MCLYSGPKQEPKLREHWTNNRSRMYEKYKLKQHVSTESPFPSFCCYQWSPWTLTLIAQQCWKVAKLHFILMSVNESYLRNSVFKRDGIKWIWRPTNWANQIQCIFETTFVGNIFYKNMLLHGTPFFCARPVYNCQKYRIVKFS